MVEINKIIFFFLFFQVSSQKPSYVVVPSLDGSLYAFDTSDNALNPIPVSAGKSVMVGNDALAGGTILSSTGIDPATGQVQVIFILILLVHKIFVRSHIYHHLDSLSLFS